VHRLTHVHLLPVVVVAELVRSDGEFARLLAAALACLAALRVLLLALLETRGTLPAGHTGPGQRYLDWIRRDHRQEYDRRRCPGSHRQCRGSQRGRRWGEGDLEGAATKDPAAGPPSPAVVGQKKVTVTGDERVRLEEAIHGHRRFVASRPDLLT